MAADAARVSSSKNGSPAAEARARRRTLATPGGLSLIAVALGGTAYLLVPRMGPAYGEVGTDQRVRVSSSVVVVGVGDTGSVTVQGEVPGRPGSVVRCVRVRFAGPGRGRVELRVDVGRQPTAVDVVVERAAEAGVGGSGECSRFRPEATVHAGPLAGLRAPAGAADWAAQPGAEAVYRFTFTSGRTDDASTSLSALVLWSAVRPTGPASPPSG